MVMAFGGMGMVLGVRMLYMFGSWLVLCRAEEGCLECLGYLCVGVLVAEGVGDRWNGVLCGCSRRGRMGSPYLGYLE